MSDVLALSVNPTSLLKANEVKLTINDDAKMLKEQALGAAKKILSITPGNIEDVNKTARLLKNCLKYMESSRKTLKAPIVEVGKAIDAVANEYSEELSDEEARLKGLLSAYVEEQHKAQLAEIKATGDTTVTASAGEGIASVDKWEFEITDPVLAYQSNPGLFDLVPKKAAIIGGAKLGVNMPGIRTWQSTAIRITA